MAIPTNKKTLIPLATQGPINVQNRSLCIVPGFVSAEIVLTSPLYIEMAGVTTLRIQHDGNTVLDIWRSINALNPVNWDEILGGVPEGESPDYSNLEFEYVGEYRLKKNETEIPAGFIQEMRGSRVGKLEVVSGADISLGLPYGSQ